MNSLRKEYTKDDVIGMFYSLTNKVCLEMNILPASSVYIIYNTDTNIHDVSTHMYTISVDLVTKLLGPCKVTVLDIKLFFGYCNIMDLSNVMYSKTIQINHIDNIIDINYYVDEVTHTIATLINRDDVIFGPIDPVYGFGYYVLGNNNEVSFTNANILHIPE